MPRRPRRSIPTRRKQRCWPAVKADHPESFEDALAEYRDVMDRARALHRAGGIATLPAQRPAGRGARPPSTCARSRHSPRTSRPPPSTSRARASTSSPRRSTTTRGAMREHNRASISNTSIHEAYPGHHLQLSAALERPTITPPADRRTRVRRGLGHVQRAADARARVRCHAGASDDAGHRRHLARLPDHPRHPAPPGRDRGRRRHRLPHRAHRLRTSRTPLPRSIAIHRPRPIS